MALRCCNGPSQKISLWASVYLGDCDKLSHPCRSTRCGTRCTIRNTASSRAGFSASGILTGGDATNLGLFQEDTDARISGTFAFNLAGRHLLGDVIAAGVDVDLAADLTLSCTIAGAPGIFTAAVVVPGPGTLVLLAGGALSSLLLHRLRRKAVA